MSPAAARLDKLRARSADDKALRRRSLVESARRLLRSSDWSELRVADVARGAGVGKASVFRYFRSKEELVLDVYLLELAELFGELAGRLTSGQVRGPEPVAHLLAQALAARPLFVRLAAAMQAVLSRHISFEAACRFKRDLVAQLSAAGAAIEICVPGLPPGSGPRALLRFHAVIIGVWQMTDHPPNVQRAIDELGLDVFRLDFAREVEAMFVTLLRGMVVSR
jgi:AcrR family transcriptional regulator